MVPIATAEEVAQNGDAAGVAPAVAVVLAARARAGASRSSATASSSTLVLAAIGVAVLLGGMFGWALEPPDDEDLPPAGHDGHGDGDGEVASRAVRGRRRAEEVTAGD